MPEPTRIFWDACAWIAYIQKEMPGPDSSFTEPRYEMCRAVLLEADAGTVDIVTSAYTLAEVCKAAKDPTSPGVDLGAFFNQRYILLTNVDKQVGLRAQSLQLAGVGKLSPQDAIHLASALVANTPIFHTFDRDLLALDNVFTLDDGNKMRIVKPTEENPQVGLFTQWGGIPQ
jgi:predicted nucleic acid-binding protein